MKIYVEKVGGITLDQAAELLKGYPGGVEYASRQALKRTLQSMRTSAIRETRKVYDIKYKVFSEKDGGHDVLNEKRHYKQHAGYTEAIVDYSGYKIPLYKFNGGSPLSPTVNPNKTVTVQVHGAMRHVHPSVAAKGKQRLDSKPSGIPGMFTAEMKNAKGPPHVGFFKREDWGSSTPIYSSTGSQKIREIYGDAAPQFFGNQEVAMRIGGAAAETFNKRLEHEVERIRTGQHTGYASYVERNFGISKGG